MKKIYLCIKFNNCKNIASNVINSEEIKNMQCLRFCYFMFVFSSVINGFVPQINITLRDKFV